MTFVHPNFLWALTLLAIPILIHLFHFRRYKKVLFPNVKFLKDVKKQTQSVKKVRDLLVLLARLLAIAFLVFAFAQPYIPIENQQVNGEDEVVGIYLDNSFSMENEGSEGPLFEEAKKKARELVNSYKATDRFIVNSNSTTSLTPVNQEDAITLIDNIDIQKTSKSLEDAILSVHKAVSNVSATKKHLYLLSDFQKSNDLAFSGSLDSNTHLTAIPLVASESNNLSIDSAWIESPVILLSEPIALKVSISNHGSSPINSGSINLDINGERKAVTGFELDGDSKSTFELGFTLSKGGWQELKLSIEDNPIIFDDTYFLSFNVKKQLEVLVVNGGNENQFVNKLFDADSYYKLNNQTAGNIDLKALETADLLVLNEVISLSSGIIVAINEYATGGGNVLIIPSDNKPSEELKSLTSSLGIPAYGAKNDVKINVGKLDLQHPLFDKVFKEIPKNPNFPTISKYFRLITNQSNYYPLMQLENQDVFLSTSSIGTGNVYQLAVPLSSEWSNFQQHALFVPSILKMAMNRSVDYPLHYTISNQNIFKATPESKGMQGELSLISAESEWMPVVNNAGSSPYIDAGYDNLTAGNIKLQTNDSLLQIIAFNFDRSESSNTYRTKDELTSFVPNITMDVTDNPATYVKETVTQHRFGKQFWKTCIILSLIFIAIEILLLRFWPTTVSQSKG